MALGDLYVTSAELKTRLGITDTDDDVRILGAVQSATQSINRETRRDFQQNTTASARKYSADTARLLYTHDFYTTTGLVVKLDEDDDGVFEKTVASTDFQLEPLDGVVDSSEGWPFWKVRLVNGTVYPCFNRAGIEVTARWGWTAVPVNIKEAAYILAEDIFKLRDTPFGIGGFAEFGRIRARENPHVSMLIKTYMKHTLSVR